jgi:hypothetical protein
MGASGARRLGAHITGCCISARNVRERRRVDAAKTREAEVREEVKFEAVRAHMEQRTSTRTARNWERI